MSFQDLRLSFTPEAIREHFEADEDYGYVDDLTDEQLVAVAEVALQDDGLYEAFHHALLVGLDAMHRDALKGA